MSVIPSHRRLGIGSLLMAAGVSRADELGVECWMEASDMGKPLYEKYDFRSLFKMAFDTGRKGVGDVWRKCEHELMPPPLFMMWRPKRGVWETEGKEVRMPWDLGAE